MKQQTRQLRNALIAIAAVLITVPLNAQPAPPEAQRISLQIATGPAAGSYLRVGETIARIVSHPPGLTRCDVPGVCGPEGLIATLRSSSGSVANVIAVNSGRVRSALVQGDVAAAAFQGVGPFKQTGPLKNMRAIARLHEETIHLVAASRSRIRKLGDLVGKRVAIDSTRSATNYTARLVIETANLDPARIKLSVETPERAAEALKNGKLDAFFAVGVAPIAAVDGLMRRGQARLVALDTRAINTLTRSNPMFTKYTLPSDSYRSSKATPTLNIAAVWVVQTSLPDSTVRAILRSLWNPANRDDLRRMGKIADTIDAAKAAENLPLPLHPGAERFYSEAGR